MENATKALLIAGGVLIAIIILSMLLMMYNKISEIKNAQEEEKETQQLVAFNSQFEAYNKKLMYGTDVKTLINKVLENNEKYPISIYINLESENVSDVKEVTQEDKKNGIFNSIGDKNRYKCTNMEYGEDGRVNEIKIVFIGNWEG